MIKKNFILISLMISTANVIAFECPKPGEKADITNTSDLEEMFHCDSTDAIFVLVNDIDATNVTLNQQNWFMGTFDGGYHKITNYHSDNGAIFLSLTGGAVIKNLKLENVQISNKNNLTYDLAVVASSQSGDSIISNVSVTGSLKQYSNQAYFTGGLVGAQSDAVITKSVFNGAITLSGGSGIVGGLVGAQLSDTSIITDSYADANIFSGNIVGGLVGSQINSIPTLKNSYSSGNISNSITVGGLVGSYSNTLSNNFASNCINSYWDSSTSKIQTSAACNEGKRETSDMQNPVFTKTYIDWDFTNTWKLNNVNSYPVLSWEIDPIVKK